MRLVQLGSLDVSDNPATVRHMTPDYMPVLSDHVNIAGLDRGAVLAALVNAAQPFGMGFLSAAAAGSDPMTATQGAAELIAGKGYVDYVWGRPIKVTLTADSFDPRLYDRDQGVGAAHAAIQTLRASA